MSLVPGIDRWNQFDNDPRNAANAALRASDHDRGVIESLLADAFAEGRLTHAEYDERSDTAMASRTLGELMPLIADLPVARAPRTDIMQGTDITQGAVRAYQQERRQAIWGFISASLICWAIWAATTGFSGFPWPLFVMLGTGLNAGRIIFSKQEHIDEATRQLEKKERKALEKRAIQEKRKEWDNPSD